MACSWCKKDVAPSAKFCPHCGAENPYEDNSMSTIESFKYLFLSTPTKPFDAWIALIICSLILYFLFLMGFGPIREEGFTLPAILSSLIWFSILILFIKNVWLKAFKNIFPSNTSKNKDIEN